MINIFEVNETNKMIEQEWELQCLKIFREMKI